MIIKALVKLGEWLSWPVEWLHDRMCPCKAVFDLEDPNKYVPIPLPEDISMEDLERMMKDWGLKWEDGDA